MTTQHGFRSGLLDPDHPAPEGLVDGHARPAGKRYDVYRNNVSHSLIEALKTAFPLVFKLIGAERFAAIAPQYVREHPPTSPVMMFFGEDFPTFLANTPALHDTGYLHDAAMLDLAMRRSYHAADAAPFDPVVFTADPETVLNLKVSLAPAVQIIRSPWPLFDIWRFTMEPGSPKPQPVAQNVLITRPEFDPSPHALPAGAADWLDALAAGETFGDAIEAAGADFDLEGALSLALTHHAFAATD